MSVAEQFSPGELVRCRGRDWVVVGADSVLSLRPLTGSEAEIETILPHLETEPVVRASFDNPTAGRIGGRDAAQLLRDALRLSLRRGAGPFRGAGRINFQPRAYQLAPLMMALRQDTVRLLIADDVGVGKTIEAGLILRELLDRGEVDRFTVLCPPHLVDQWTRELVTKFSIPATAVTASIAARLERDLPMTTSIFEAYPYTVVSLDFIKSERRFYDFRRACPGLVVVDEAHAAVSAGTQRQRRYELVRALARDRERDLILLTATPHSGDDTAFHNLLGLIDEQFAKLPDLPPAERRPLREKLAAHFIQRRRGDIDAWREPGLFPQHETSELRYRLTGDYETFYRHVLDYCTDVVVSEEDNTRQRLAFWGTLALMRCVGSSPAAAARALRTRACLDGQDADEDGIAARTLDDEEYSEDDFEPEAGTGDPRLTSLIRQADKLSVTISDDPKYRSLVSVLKDLTGDGFAPVVFCRYIATAQRVAEALSNAFKSHVVDVVTGMLPPEEREIRVEELGGFDRRILVTTDCLSEGINLQAWFDAVIHYDLSWNPTRHQQREGRIDRFGQRSSRVRSVMIYGENNPVDGAVLGVILRKAHAIERQTGVRVPLPDEKGGLMKALMSAVLLRARERRQLTLDLDLDSTEEARELDLAWRNAAENEKRSRTVFAQNSLKPDEVLREWDVTQSTLGGEADTKRFVSRAMQRLDATLMPLESGAYRAPVHLTPETFRERFVAESLIEDAANKPITIGFGARPPAGAIAIHRAHPLPAVLAETFIERAMDSTIDDTDLTVLPRTGAWESSAVDEVTWLALLRIRHRIDSRGKLGPSFSMAEEAAAIAFSATNARRLCSGDAAFALLDDDGFDLPPSLQQATIDQGLSALPSLEQALSAYATERARALAQDHMRVRRSLGSTAGVQVVPITPVDTVGFYILMPRL